MTGVVIHALPVLRGIVAIAPLPGSGGDYDADLLHIEDWRPAIVVTMTPLSELMAAAAGGLGRDIGYLGTRWIHVPTPDHAVPEGDALRSWTKAEEAALAALRGGGRVLIHGRRGCGRSGMAALRLMIGAGEAEDAALARLRCLQPGAVETSAQMRWALRGRIAP